MRQIKDKMQKTTDMTKGTPWKLILNFAFPLILTNLGQQVYMIVDAAIVGKGVGVKALAAVGSADWTYWMILWTIVGFTQGFSVFISRSFGDKNYGEMNKTIAMSTILCAVVGCILTPTGILATRPLLELLDTPSDIIDGAEIYLITMISGTLVVMAYNMAASVLRALGDGKTPLIAMLIAALLNVGLDLLFVIVFKWGIFGAAAASVLSQLVSFIYCFLQIKNIACIKMDPNAWKLDFKMLRNLLVFGLPLAFQYIIIALGGIILQSTINLQGSIFVAGYTAVNKIYGLLESTAISLGTAFSTFFAQNYGAGYIDRVKRGIGTAVKMSIMAALAISALALAFGKHMLRLFLDVSEEGGPEALEIGWYYLAVIAALLVILYLLHLYRNILQSMGIAVWSLLSGIAEFAVRVGMGKAVVAWIGTKTLFYIEPAAWLGGLLFVMIPYFFCRKKYLSESK